MSDEVTVRDVPERSRYEAHVGDELAGYVLYERHGDRITLVHTKVEDEFEGHGVGGHLARAALDDIRARGLHVVVQCPFIRSYLERHPEYQDLVAP